MRIVLVDNRDSFVYNLVDALGATGNECTVFRNNVPADTIVDAGADVIVLSPGPGHPATAGSMMEVIRRVYGHVPLLGVCLGFQALLLHNGLNVRRCGPVHGRTDGMRISNVSRETSAIFEGLHRADGTVPVARYHSLGVPLIDLPHAVEGLGVCDSVIGDVVMAAEFHTEGTARAFGVQFHPESILTPGGPTMLARILSYLTEASPARNSSTESDTTGEK